MSAVVKTKDLDFLSFAKIISDNTLDINKNNEKIKKSLESVKTFLKDYGIFVGKKVQVGYFQIYENRNMTAVFFRRNSFVLKEVARDPILILLADSPEAFNLKRFEEPSVVLFENLHGDFYRYITTNKDELHFLRGILNIEKPFLHFSMFSLSCDFYLEEEHIFLKVLFGVKFSLMKKDIF